MEWLNQFEPQIPAGAITWLVIAILAVILLLLLLTLYRRLTGSLRIAGGRGRKARLAVMDTAPVDADRRLVLVRRDDVEHLVMIGGPSDIVVEQSIRIGAATMRARSILDDEDPAKPVAATGNGTPLDAPGRSEPFMERRRSPQPLSPPPSSASITPLKRPLKPQPTAVLPANGNGSGTASVKPETTKEPAIAKPAMPISASAKTKDDGKDDDSRKTVFGTLVAEKSGDKKDKDPQAEEATAKSEPPKAEVKPAEEPIEAEDKEEPAAAEDPTTKPADAAETAEDVETAGKSDAEPAEETEAETKKKQDAKDGKSQPTDELEQEMERLLSELTGTTS